MKLFVIGDRETVLGFRLVGVEGAVVTDRAEALSAMQSAADRKEIGLMLITERVVHLIQEEFDARAYGVGFPLVLEIPDITGPSPSRLSIKEIVSKGIGVSI